MLFRDQPSNWNETFVRSRDMFQDDNRNAQNLQYMTPQQQQQYLAYIQQQEMLALVASNQGTFEADPSFVGVRPDREGILRGLLTKVPNNGGNQWRQGQENF